ncbi:DUF4124 domain-containing protein [Janthinobacterium sp.]|uniref:DUF4124 domain-containing protein n=1 Tax=Janthinobacterium sp. TaxID=1871054 RepID=UPI00293D5E5B|nr:DUF4124 domain-containing protein [Janthinobacterium sp.]
MNRIAFFSTLGLSAILAASTAFAGTEILKCTDTSGHVVLTNEPCENASASASDDLAAPLGEAATPGAPARMTATPAATLAPRRDPLLRKSDNVPVISRDAETLKTARITMLKLDLAAAMQRQQRLAGLN